MATASFEQVLKEARKLSSRTQAELAETLLKDYFFMKGEFMKREWDSSRFIEIVRQTLLESSSDKLTGMSKAELQTLVSAILAPGRQRRLHSLLQKNKSGNLKPEESKELGAILDDCDRIALIKAKAQYTLMLSEQKREASI